MNSLYEIEDTPGETNGAQVDLLKELEKDKFFKDLTEPYFTVSNNKYIHLKSLNA